MMSNRPPRPAMRGALLASLALLLLIPACDLDAGVFTLDETVRLTFTFSGTSVSAGQTVTVTSTSPLNLLQIVEQHSFTAANVVSASIAAVGSRPEIEIIGPNDTMDAFASAEIRAGGIPLLSGSAFPAQRAASLTRLTNDIRSLVVAGAVPAQLTLVTARPLMSGQYSIDVLFDVVIGVDG